MNGLPGVSGQVFLAFARCCRRRDDLSVGAGVTEPATLTVRGIDMKNKDNKAAHMQRRRRWLLYIFVACIPVWAVVAAINGSKGGGGAIGALFAAAITVGGLVTIVAGGVGGAAAWKRLSGSGTDVRDGRHEMRFNPGDFVSAPNAIVDRKLFGADDVLVPRGTRGRIVSAYPIGASAGIRSVYPVYDVNWNNGRVLRVEEHLLVEA